MLVIRIGFQLLLECGNCCVVKAADAEAGESEIVPAPLWFSDRFRSARSKQRDRCSGIARIKRGEAGFEKFVRGGRCGISGEPGVVLSKCQRLGFVLDRRCARKVVIAGARRGQVAHFEVEASAAAVSVLSAKR